MDAPKQPVTLGPYSYQQTDSIGQGYSSVVFRGCDTRTGQLVAVKVVDLRQLKDELHRELLRNELNCLKRLSHTQNVVKALEVITTPHATNIVMEYCERGDLSRLRAQHPQITDEQVIGIVRQLITGCTDMWKAGIVHRDLKPANIFVRGKAVKIADFGFAASAEQCSTPSAYNIGSPSYMAPEALKRNQYSYQSDIWALGVVAFELLFGKLPWKADNDLFLYQMLTNQPISTLMDRQRPISACLREFVAGCCEPSLRLRLKPEEVAIYDWSGRTSRKSVIGQPRVGLHEYMRDKRTNSILTTPSAPFAPFATGTQLSSPRSTSSQNTVRPLAVLRSATKQTAESQQIIPLASIANLQIAPVVVVECTGLVKEQRPSAGIKPQIRETPSGAQTEPRVSTEGKFGGASKQAASDCIVSQLHYCRFVNMLLCQLEEQPSLLLEALKLELLRRIELLNIMATDGANLLELHGFNSLVADCEAFEQLRQLIWKYHSRYGLKHNPNGSFIALVDDPTSLEQLLKTAIKVLQQSDQPALLCRLTTMLQLKQLERRTDYNNFGEQSKIAMLMEHASEPPDSSSLRLRLQLLGIS